MNLDISGEIRHPVDYLVDLIETKDRWETLWICLAGSKVLKVLFELLGDMILFDLICISCESLGEDVQVPPKEYRENTIDTMWLDGLIASKAIAPSLSVTQAGWERGSESRDIKGTKLIKK